jgi:hypothetical protein
MRPVAFILSGFMAAAYFMAHSPMSFFAAINMGEARCFTASSSFISRPPALDLGRSIGSNGELTDSDLEEIALGSARIVAALAKRGDAVSDRVYIARFDAIAICSRRLPARRPAGPAGGARRARRRWRN